MSDTRTTAEAGILLLAAGLDTQGKHAAAAELRCNLTHLTARIEALEAGISNVESALTIQGESGNWDYNGYMHGMFNGLAFAVAMLHDREPDYRNAPEEWLEDKASPHIDHAERVMRG